MKRDSITDEDNDDDYRDFALMETQKQCTGKRKQRVPFYSLLL